MRRSRSKSRNALVFGWVVLSVVGLVGCGALGGRGSYNNAWGPQQKCEAVHYWVGNFSAEIPKPPAGTKSHSEYYKNLSVNLFRDEYFVPVFGTPFDQMSETKRQALGNQVGQCFVMSGKDTYKNWQDLNRHYGTVMPHWQQDGVEFARSARDTSQWQERILKELRSAPSTDETFGKYLQAKAHAKEAMERFLPAAQQRFNEALDHEGRRVAEAALIARIDKVSAAASTYEGLRELQNVIDDRVGLFNLVSPSVKQREQTRAAEAYRQGLPRVLGEDWKRFEARGAGIEGVKNGVRWYRDFEDRYYGSFEIGPPFNDLITRVREARDKDLASSSLGIIEMLKPTKTIEALNRAREEYLIDEIDELGKGAKPIYVWIVNHELKINFEKEKWKFSANELAMMTIPGIVSVPDSYGPPSGDDIRMALLRAYVNAGGRLVDRHTATVVTASFGDLLGTFGNGGLPRIPWKTASIGEIRVEGCSETKGLVSYPYQNAKRYECRYVGGNTSKSDEFTLTSEGWLSPTADDRIAEMRDLTTMKFITDIGSAVPKVGCIGRRGVLNWWCR